MIEAIGSRMILLYEALIEFFRLLVETCWAIVVSLSSLRFRLRETIDQMYVVAVQSIPIIVVSLSFVSLMLTIEFSFQMNLVLRQDSLVPAFSTLLVVRELGPVITCLLLTSRVGASIAAEVGTMKVTEQIDALRLLAIDPVEYLVLPRWFACAFAAVALSLISIGIAICGGAFIAAIELGYGPSEYFNSMFLFVRQSDILDCGLKALVFGSIIPFMGCYHGFRCQYGAEGVGRATTAAVVHATMMIIITDFVLTYLLYAI